MCVHVACVVKSLLIFVVNGSHQKWSFSRTRQPINRVAIQFYFLGRRIKSELNKIGTVQLQLKLNTAARLYRKDAAVSLN